MNEEDDQHQDRDLAEHGAGIGLEELVGDAEREGADQRAPQIPDAAEHHHHEAVDDVALAEIGADIVDLRQRDAGDAGDARAEPEGEGVDAAGADAHRRRHRPVLRHRAHFQTEPRIAQDAEQRDEYREREADDPEPVIGDGDAAEIERAAHPRRIADFAVVRTERRAHRLLQDERQAPRRQQGLERPAVEKPDDEALDQDADDRGEHKRQRQRDGQRIVEQRRIVVADELLHHERDIGAEHHHFAVRHVDDAHHAEGDGKTDGGEEEHRAERNAVPGVLHRVPQHQAVLDRGDRARSRLGYGRRGTDGQAREQAERVLIAALADDVDGGEPVLFLGVVAEQLDRGAGLEHGALDARVLFLGEGGLERRQRGVVARLENGLRRLVAGLGIVRQQRERADRRVERAAQPVVDAHRFEIGRRGTGNRSAGGGIGQLAGLVLDVNRLAFGREHQLAVLQGANDGFGTRTTARGHRTDAIRGFAEIVGSEMRQRFLETGRADWSAPQCEAEDQYERSEKRSMKTHGMVPGLEWGRRPRLPSPMLRRRYVRDHSVAVRKPRRTPSLLCCSGRTCISPSRLRCPCRQADSATKPHPESSF